MRYRNLIVQSIFGGLLALLSTGCASTTELPAGKVFTVVTSRNLSDVAMDARLVLAEPPSRVGAQLIIGETFTWLDGMTYADWSEEWLRALPLGRLNPMLEDVYYGQSSNSEIKRPMLYSFNGHAIGTVYWVDDRIGLVAAKSGSPVYILEAPLTLEEGLLLESKLEDMKLDPGPVDGVIDASTRRALGFYYESRGLKYRFATPVISTALLQELIGQRSE